MISVKNHPSDYQFAWGHAAAGVTNAFQAVTLIVNC
ncbi:hypothetical protein CCP4SC76_5880006 [Gammaproteobacteria bacterium]